MSKALLVVCLTVLTAGERARENFALEPEVYRPRKPRTSRPTRPFPKTCEGGAIDLQGVYEVLEDSVITVTRGCKLKGSGAKGANILLHAHLTFAEEPGSSDHDGVSFVGAIRFVGMKSFKQACVTVRGHLVIGGDFDGDPDANIKFVRCHNQDRTSYGGALHVVNGLTVRSGFVTIRDSSSSAGGGGLYIKSEGLHQQGGMILLQECRSDGSGGGLFASAATGLQQDAGNISCVGCAAAHHGGCMAINGSAKIGGFMHAENCSADSGGAVSVADELVSWGRMEFGGCRANAGGGGGLRVESDFFQNAGIMKFWSCTAARDGGAMDLDKSLHARGTAEFNSCHAEGDGGAIKLQDDLQQAEGGNMSFGSCTARRGGAVAVRRLEASGIMEFRDCHAADSGGAAIVKSDFVQNAGHIQFASCNAREGGAAVIRGDLVSDGRCSINACHAEEGSVLEVSGDITVPEFPTDCPDGELELSGMFVVDWVPSNDGNCKVRGTGATVLLKEPLVFEGAVEFLGMITFIGLTPMDQACVTVHGSVTIGGSSDEADILFTGCHSKDIKSAGGALHIVQGLTVVSGVLEIERSSSLKGGGGVYIDRGNLHQLGGSIKINTSTSERHGGGLLIGNGKLVQAAGQISCHNCFARNKGKGGCLALMRGGNYSLQTNGSIEAESCTAYEGGALFISAGHWVSFGHINLNRCHARKAGGAAKVRGSIFQMKGTVTLAWCTAASSGGGIMATGSFVQKEGWISCQACSSLEAGGCIAVVDKIVQSKSGFANFTACSASGNGGALFAEFGAVVLGGSSTFEDCSSTGSPRGNHGGCLYTKGHVNFQGFTTFTRCQAAGNGGAVSARSSESGGHIAFNNCTAGFSGGGLHLEASFHQVGGSATFVECGAVGRGGGLHVEGGISLEGLSTFERCGSGGHQRPRFGGGMRASGSVVIFSEAVVNFKGCAATIGGGGLAVDGVVASNGTLDFQECKTFGASGGGGGGGGLHLQGDFRQGGGHTKFNRCHATGGPGGGLAIRRGSLIQTAGILDIIACSATRGGGAAVQFDALQHGGKLSVAKCHSSDDGGGLHLGGNFRQKSYCAADFLDCTANGGGGGLAVLESVYLAGSSTFKSCKSHGSLRGGGGLLVNVDFFQNGGKSSFEDCRARAFGGGLHVRHNLTAASGIVNFSRCSALGGGGAFVYLHVHALANASVCLDSCTAQKGGSGGGMGLQRGSLFQRGGNIRFSRCEAPGGKGGGLALLEGSLKQFSGSLGFEDCESGEGAGLFVGRDVLMAGGRITFRNCRALQEGGGAGALVKHDFLQHAGELLADSCKANGNGGGLRVGGDFIQLSETSARFTACRAQIGGGLSVDGSVNVSGSNTFEKCVASATLAGAAGGGGCLYSHQSFAQLGGRISFAECQTLSGGGAVLIGNGSLIAKSGTMLFHSCSAAQSGGGASVALHVHIQPEANVVFRACDSAASGGGVYLGGDLIQDGGSISFDTCQASDTKGYGGGIALQSGHLHQVTGRMQFVGCRAAAGGGIWVQRGMTIVDAAMTLSGCQAYNSSVGGGCIYVEQGNLALDGNLSMTNCSSLGSGGGLLMDRGGVHQRTAGILTFDHCHAHGGNGGGMAACSLVSEGTVGFSSCTASQGGGGGGLYISTGNGTIQQDAGHMSFQNCSAGQTGGGFYLGSAGPGKLADVSFYRCTTEGNAGTLYAESDVLTVSNLTILEPRSADFDIVSQGLLMFNGIHLHSMNQKFSMGIQAKSLSAGTVNCTNLKSCSLAAPEQLVADLVCPRGTGVREGNGLKSCSECDDNYTQPAGSAKCVSCPTHNEFCYTTNFKMSTGYMVKQEDISSTIFCPNPAACPGGISTDFSTMCAPGHGGQACAYCQKGYAISDRSVLQCAACATEWWQKLLQWAIMLAKHVVPFAVAAHSALQVEGAEEPKRSGVLINQLMSFATVAGTLLTVVAQTSAIREAKQNAASLGRDLLNAAGIAADFISGQGYLQHAAGFQFEPESSGEQTFECPFVKQEFHRHVVRILMVSAFLAVSYVWVRLSLSKKDGPKPPLHVIFLSRAYRQTCQLWESERLMRKTLLTLAVSALPITSSPSLQLVCIATIVIGSLFLHAAVLPYKTMSFNLTECALLTAAALMTATVTGLTAYDHYWGRTMLVEYLMIFSVVGVATLICAAMIFLIVKELQGFG
ncbi:unnamed protein product [Symbiodinium sp. CCMP2592]|nr:unnamed protein product [Symbiodinium sp. CCMP2592]